MALFSTFKIETPVKIFDLDGTVINSHHRTEHAHVNGKFCLDTYLNKCNRPEQIAQDVLLPLAAYMQSLIAKGEQIAIITARYLGEADIEYLHRHRLIDGNTIIMGRESVTKVVRALPDPLYKVEQLNRLKAQYSPRQRFVMFEDITPVINRLAQEKNITMVNAIGLNSELEYSQQINPCELTRNEVVETHVSAKEFSDFCTDQMIAG